MAVYTAIDDASLDAFLAAYDIGRAVSLQGITEGVENSNYLLITERGRFILTLYERRVDPSDLPSTLRQVAGGTVVGHGLPGPVTAAIHASYWNKRAQGWLGEPVDYDAREPAH